MNQSIHSTIDQLHFTPQIFTSPACATPQAALRNGATWQKWQGSPQSAARSLNLVSQWLSEVVFVPFKHGGNMTMMVLKGYNIWVVSTPLTNISQNGNLPQIGVKIKKYLKPPPKYNIWFLSWFGGNSWLKSYLHRFLVSWLLQNQGSNTKSMMMFQTFNTYSTETCVYTNIFLNLMCNHRTTPPVSGT